MSNNNILKLFFFLVLFETKHSSLNKSLYIKGKIGNISVNVRFTFQITISNYPMKIFCVINKIKKMHKKLC